MPITRSTRRSRRLRNPKSESEQQGNTFFQPKLTIGRSDDKYEREADSVANAVVNNQNARQTTQGQQAVQRQISGNIQRIATPDEEKMPATNDERIAEDKRIQEKPELQRMGDEKEPTDQMEEEPTDQMEEEPTDQKEEELTDQMEEEPTDQMEEEPTDQMEEEPTDQKEEEPTDQMEEEPTDQMEEEPTDQMEEEPTDQKEEEPTDQMEEEPTDQMDEEPTDQKEEEPTDQMDEEKLQPKSTARPAKPPAGFSARITARKGHGQPLPRSVRAQMEQGIGADFSNVRIHTDAEAAKMSKSIKAQAFTRGNDVYFNIGKFNPSSTEGKRLLAHELTHVVQQGHAKIRIQRKGASVSTPKPPAYKAKKDRSGNLKHYYGKEAGTDVIILPDKTGGVPKGSSGYTSFSVSSSAPGCALDKSGRVSKINGKATVEVTIQTSYKRGVNPEADSAYGRGTTAADKKAGDKSLRFHEGSHGTEYIQYMRKHPVPTFKGRIGMTRKQYKQAMTDFDQAIQTYVSNMKAHGIKHVDCVGTKAGFCH